MEINAYFKHFKNFKLYKNLAKQIVKGKLTHSHLFVCEDSFSAKVFSMLIAKTLLCNTSNACSTCPSCLKVLNQSHADLYVLPKEKRFVVADSHFIIENAYTKPINSNKKVFVLNDFHDANAISQNKILKILEEPNKNVYFLINTTNEKNLLATINSRVQKHFIPPFSKQELKSILQKSSVEFLQSATSLSDGYLGRALNLSKNKDFEKSYNFVLDMLKNMKQSKDVIKFSSEMSERSTFVLKLEIMERLFRNMIVLKSGKGLEDNEELTVRPFVEEFSVLALLSILNRVVKANTHFASNVNTPIIADNLLIGILEDKFLWQDA